MQGHCSSRTMCEHVQAVLADASRHNDEASLPYVTLSYAQSIDGSIASLPGRPLCISSAESMTFTHRLRAAHDAVLVGIGTVLADDPELTVRLVNGRDPQPVIIDSRLRFPLDARVLAHHPSKSPWIMSADGMNKERERVLRNRGALIYRLPALDSGWIDILTVLKKLRELGIRSIMVEGGRQIISSFIRNRLVDQVIITISPCFIGGLRGLGNIQENHFSRSQLENVRCEMFGKDLVLCGDLLKEHHAISGSLHDGTLSPRDPR
ncbi:MAG TPA: dihydrofolate reductase family protein [Thermodesulfobacteriota bacterium]|nr:dihydrofolate reductase family protein [Deltaproteobacteria bacterium]HNR12643.1 dihydrofolate reductase family protein [Thermodesulfobacteriota bacterium]HNU72793.1 dihydrofolate reductase family protein [Thermodesulfobacteriota bacterium]HOC39534.1 dihydrofolate reductase family protein [Thermodesulfobacteriota bacterium]HQO77787.1 dihydrofolate reductase family protein [Thermodesulfobacteriota bacterium]